MATSTPGSKGATNTPTPALNSNIRIKSEDPPIVVIQKGREKWPRGTIDVEKAKDIEIGEFIIYKGNAYKEYDYTDDDLWEAYQLDFGNFTAETFKRGDTLVTRQMRVFLRARGVWVNMDKSKTLQESLYEAAQEITRSKWLPEEVIEYIEANDRFESPMMNRMALSLKQPVAAAPETNRQESSALRFHTSRTHESISLQQNTTQEGATHKGVQNPQQNVPNPYSSQDVRHPEYAEVATSSLDKPFPDFTGEDLSEGSRLRTPQHTGSHQSQNHGYQGQGMDRNQYQPFQEYRQNRNQRYQQQGQDQYNQQGRNQEGQGQYYQQTPFQQPHQGRNQEDQGQYYQQDQNQEGQGHYYQQNRNQDYQSQNPYQQPNQGQNQGYQQPRPPPPPLHQGQDQDRDQPYQQGQQYQRGRSEKQQPPPPHQGHNQYQLDRDLLKEIHNMNKSYERDSKYSGKNDTYDYKLAIFNNYCRRVGISGESKVLVYPAMLTGPALKHYLDNETAAGLNYNPTFDELCEATRKKFEGPEYRRGIEKKWEAASLKEVIKRNPGKSTSECFETLVEELRHLQHGLDKDSRTDSKLHTKLSNACKGVKACDYVCLQPTNDPSIFIENMKVAITTWEESHGKDNAEQYYTDRRYYSRRPRSLSRSNESYRKDRRDGNRDRRDNNRRPFKGRRSKACFVCNKEGRWSTKHTKEELEKSKTKFRAKFGNRFDRRADHYILEIEGTEEDDGNDTSSIDEAIEALILEEGSSGSEVEEPEQFITSFGAIQAQGATELFNNLTDQSCMHALTAHIADQPAETYPFVHKTTTTTDRYNADTFYGVMIDTGASKRSTAGYGQYLAYKKLNNVEIDTSLAGAVHVHFGIGSTSSIGSIIIELPPPLGRVEFHVVRADTPFLLCLDDLDDLKAYYNNIEDLVCTASGTVPVVRRFGHPFILWGESLNSYIAHSFTSNPCYLTSTELRRLHRRFGHPSANRLYKILERAGHAEDISRKAIEKLNRFCQHCQIHGKSPGRFKFTLRDDDIQFNCSIIVDIMYIDQQPILHIIDEATRYQAARWLKDVSAKNTWEALRYCWIDTYLGPPELIIHDAGKNFDSKEFRMYAKSMSISTKTVPIEAHWSIGMVERAHPTLKRAYEIITTEIPGIKKEIALQTAVKAVNDTAGPDGLVPTLLVYGAYPRISELDPPTPTVVQRAEAIQKATKEILKIRAKTQVREALNLRNGPNTTPVHNLPINSEVMVWREGKGWSGPFRLISIQGEDCMVQQPRGVVKFRSTAIKPFLRDEGSSGTEVEEPEQEKGKADKDGDVASLEDVIASLEGDTIVVQVPDISVYINKDDLFKSTNDKSTNKEDISIFINEDKISINKNENTTKISLPPLNESPPTAFTMSRRKELNGLLETGVFELVDIKDVPKGVRIFNSRFVDEIKNQGTKEAFEKSRLVVQAYGDHEKDLVLTQAPTIQRVSQRLILALTAFIQGDIAADKLALYLRDITQAYTQAKTELNRSFYIRPPTELKLQEGSLLRVVKPLYGVPEAGNHWFRTYHEHHIEQLNMKQSTYDPCLLHTKKGKNGTDPGFGVVGLQTDDTLILCDSTFARNEETQVKEAKFQSKERTQLTKDNPLKFNGGLIQLESDGSILLTQEKQCESLQLVQDQATDLKSARGAVRKLVSPRDQYVAQRARGAYVATVSQPEAAFDLSFAAQVTNPSPEDTKLLNKRIQWQLDNPKRGLRYVPLDKDSVKILTFTDSSYANNRDTSSQIGYVIVLTDKTGRANIIHWSSIKCKRVTRSVLASELYALVHGFDMGAVIKSTLDNILQRKVPLSMCTDSKSLYDCLTKLGTTQEKRLMIDIMCLRQSYERREIAEVQWIETDKNPADAMTKSRACPALKDLIDTNRIQVESNKWVERANVEDFGGEP